MTNGVLYTVRFEMHHQDIIMNVKQGSVSAYAQHNIKQDQLPKLISELNEKGYRLISVRRSYDRDDAE